MTGHDFNAILERRLALARAVLAAKAGEYATGGDQLHSFKAAAAILGGSPAEALVGMWVKHVVSVCDMVRAGRPTRERVDEKIGDAINYLILLEAVLMESP